MRTTNLEMCLDLDEELLKVLDDGAFDGASKVGVLIGYLPRLVANAVEHVLNTSVRGN
jgi:hypothetical protein